MHPVNLSTLPAKLSNAEFERACTVARHLCQAMEIDVNAFNSLTKRQKHLLIGKPLNTPHLCAAKNNKIPQAYLKNLRTTLMKELKRPYYMDPGCPLTFQEMLTDGIAFSTRLCLYYKQGAFEGTPQQESLLPLYNRCKDYAHETYVLMCVGGAIQSTLNSYSQPNYRIYSFQHLWEDQGVFSSRLRIEITAHESEHRYFTRNGVRRIAYKVDMHETELQQILRKAHPHANPFLRKNIFPNDPDGERELNLYVQSHAMHRFKERMTLIDPVDRNMLLWNSLSVDHEIVRTPVGPLIQCRIYDGRFGYFAFFVENDDVVVTTFLPIVSALTPEGRKLHRLLRLTKQENMYLGMDRLDFFAQVDIEQIPLLKQAFVDAGIYPIYSDLDQVMNPEKLPKGWGIDQDRTRNVATFFEKWKQSEVERTAYDDDMHRAEAEMLAEWEMPGAEERDAFALDAALPHCLEP